MFAWARCTVVQTGAIALVAFVYGDYAHAVVPLGAYGPAIHAALVVVLFTAINVAGTIHGKVAQQIFTALDLGALVMLIAAGLVVAATSGGPAQSLTSTAPSSYAPLGLAMVFVLLTYGGWNEASYISAELKGGARDMVRVLSLSVVFVTAIYFLVAWAYLYVLGFEGLQKSQAVAADVARSAFGPSGGVMLSVFVCGAAVSTLNATIFTGARVFYALGRDLPGLKLFGIWNPRGENPANAFILQGAIAVALVGLGALTRDGFKTMVEYTSPVFWFFMTLIAISIFVFRRRHPDYAPPYRVPLYPVLPIIFIGTCLWMLYSSLAYTGTGALVGVAVLAVGAPLLLFNRARRPAPAE
jgi:amino acid transporter